ncbi:hypothetical protein CR159_02250 [Pollutimonas subterranea]|uniref:HD domain-containing protein n=1 Tax=Pollutimonas subterranea TaxID=2045210 RepID=A0A2N4UA26_9BURK|nr:HD domain-containing protein [Pollutimonas subterranea]PLC51857.1 hypothetical protein CR159_02250 [Pollutimonas subterranea]
MQLTRLEKQLSFLKEIDRLKNVMRQSPLLDKSRKENSAEHSWHLAVYALILDEYACGAVDTNRVIQMLLLHDIVEIDVGDFPIHSGSSSDMQAEQDVSIEQVFSRYGPAIKRGAPELWEICERWIIQHFSGPAAGNTAAN